MINPVVLLTNLIQLYPFQIEAMRKSSKFADEIRMEQDERKREEEEKRSRQQAVKERAALFNAK